MAVDALNATTRGRLALSQVFPGGPVRDR